MKADLKQMKADLKQMKEDLKQTLIRLQRYLKWTGGRLKAEGNSNHTGELTLIEFFFLSESSVELITMKYH